ncbi:phosphatidylinositol transfer protein csr1 [Ophiostoma piceae UAMH 11346]|uniref:Phosphatidylinositol transfer protein csr1 n=1 Tax=Ophiostoma piceae (strain UAMH 11346) TaxID=1262450 RepID=S3CQ59_OPHP1|nr:phosphatidylinositol transfer protein csr1 [Ophiostoma piceae UAMH 11346]
MRCLSRALRTSTTRIHPRIRAQPRAPVFRLYNHTPTSTTTFLKGFSSRPPSPLESSSSTLGLVAAASLAASASLYYLFFASAPAPGNPESSTPLASQATTGIPGDLDEKMAAELAAGRIGNLTPEQEEKLRQMWAAMFRVYQFDVSSVEGTDGAHGADDDAAENEALESVASTTATGDGKKKEKKKRSLFKRSKKDAKDTKEEDSVASVTKAVGTVDLAAVSEDDKYGQGKQFEEALASLSPEAIRSTVWSMVKHDHPDALVLRFLRARKWDVDKALVMLVSTMHWRSQEMHVDDDIMLKGEAGAVADAASSADEKLKTVGEDFLAQMRMGKSYIHGTDKMGRPICIVRVRLHHQGDQVEESVERCTVYTIETARMTLQPPVDTATIIFDMTSFSLANMDYSPVKFMIKCFEANYPECLGAVLVHKSPWLFQGIWRVIRGWLDPVVASKVHFTNNVKDMEEFIARDQIIKELGGDEDWEYKFVEPEPGENDKMKDTATRDKLLAERERLFRAYEEATARWVLNPAANAEQAKAVRAERDGIASKLRDDYWVLDPYVRARSVYDRTGMLQDGGKVDFYAPFVKDEITQTNGNPTAQSDVE